MEINYSEKYSLINDRSRILKLNRMYQASYMNKKISKMKHSTEILDLILEQIINHERIQLKKETKNGRFKYMNIKYKYVQDEIKKKKKKIKLTFIGSNSMMADSLAKSISGPKLKHFADFIMEMQKVPMQRGGRES